MTVPLDAIASQHERLRPSDRYGWAAILRNTAPLFALLWLAPVLADRNPYAAWSLTPFVGLLIYRTTVVMHDCTHYTLFTSRRLNRVMGSLLGAVTGVDFRSFSHQHWRHHRSYGEPEDLPAVASAAGETAAPASMIGTIGDLYAGSRAARAAHV